MHLFSDILSSRNQKKILFQPKNWWDDSNKYTLHIIFDSVLEYKNSVLRQNKGNYNRNFTGEKWVE